VDSEPDDGVNVEHAPAKAPRWRRWLRTLAPYVVAGLAIVLVLRRYPPSSIAQEMKEGNTLGMVPLAIGMVVASLFQVSSADWLVMRGVASEPPYWVAVRGKAGSAVLNIVGYAAHVGGYGVWIARVSGMRPGLAAGVVLYILSSELAAICLLTTTAAWFGDAAPAAFAWIAPTVMLVLVGLKMLAPFGLLPQERVPQIFRPWRLVARWRALAQFATRGMHLATLTLFAWAAANVFGLPVPVGAMFVYFPIVLLVGSLPLNVAGFGAVQGAWLLLEPWAPGGGEQVLAFSLLWQLLAAVGIVLRGLPFVRRVVAEIDQGAPKKEP
jgi:hypothetical protein